MRLLRWESITRAGRWSFGIALDLGNWKVGLYYENSIYELDLHLGPLIFWFGQEAADGAFWPSGTLHRWQVGKLEIRLDWSVHQFLLGYSRVSCLDQGLYLGPIDLQIERRERFFSAWDGFTTRDRHRSFLGVLACWRQQQPLWFECCAMDIEDGELDGWANILDDALFSMALVTFTRPGYVLRLSQIKEKLGELKVYFARTSETDIDKLISDLINSLRTTSGQTCELCGKLASKTVYDGRIATRCGECAVN